MKRLAGLWKAESATIVSIVLALVAVGIIPGVWGKVLGAVLPIVGGQAVRQTVYSPPTVTSLVGQATTAVATQLGATDAGAAGQVTAAGQAVADGVAAGVLGQVGAASSSS